RLGAALTEAALGLALKVDNHDVVLGDEDLAEVVVAVDARGAAGGRAAGHGAQALLQWCAAGQQVGGQRPRLLAELRQPLLEAIENLAGLAHRVLYPVAELLAGERAAAEIRVVGGGRE